MDPERDGRKNYTHKVKRVGMQLPGESDSDFDRQSNVSHKG